MLIKPEPEPDIIYMAMHGLLVYYYILIIITLIIIIKAKERRMYVIEFNIIYINNII